MTKTILFVDEEQFVRKALRRSFRNMRDQWNMIFAGNPDEALAALESNPCDVVIAETVYSRHDGLDFLRTLRRQHPGCVRIILSGYADQNVVLKSVNIAHQYLAKPCEDETLKATIIRAFIMKDLLDDVSLKQVVSRIDTLPSVPALYLQLVDELKSENASIERIGTIIAKDIGLTTKLLKLVNSSYFGLLQYVSNPSRAVSLLGIDLIKAMVLTAGTMEKFHHLKFPGFSIEHMWEHAMQTAAFAKIIASEAELSRQDADTAFMSAMLHDIGKLLIAAHLPDAFSAILAHVRRQACTMAEAEGEIIGTNHAAVGAYLLGLWGLPDPMIDAVAFHHNPDRKPAAGISTTVIIHIANAFAHAGSNLNDPDQAIEGLDNDLLEKYTLLPSLQSWRRACAVHMQPDRP